MLYGKKPTVRSLAEEAQISTATAAKYLRLINNKP
jgi:DNA-binding transcriptional regulator YhcF (GntR family)